MSARAALRLPIRQALTQQCSPRTTRRCIHSLPRRAPTIQYWSRRIDISNRFQCRRTFAKDSTHTVRGNAKILFRNHPFQMTLATVCILAGIASIVYANYFYQTYIIGAYHNFPEEVAKKLRRAIYYTATDLQPNEALKYYQQALQVAAEIGMDPMSDEVMGIKIQVADLMERVQQIGKAVEVLERIRADNMRFLDASAVMPGLKDNQEMKKKRSNVLRRTIAISIKLGDHYSNPMIWDRDLAEERLVWGVESTLKEKARRQQNHISDEEEGPWFSDDEIGASMESLAQAYAAKDQHYLATPLYLQCLTLKETADCHSVILMNNLASSLAQQSPRAARAAQAYAESTHIKSPSAPSGPIATRESMLENAKLWAQKALAVAGTVQPPERSDECDVGCAVAMHNLGEFAEMLGDKVGAGDRYREALSLARAIGFQEGVENSSERLRKLKGLE